MIYFIQQQTDYYNEQSRKLREINDDILWTKVDIKVERIMRWMSRCQ